MNGTTLTPYLRLARGHLPAHAILERVVLYGFLWSGYLQAVLRPDPDSDVTLFRVMVLPVTLYITTVTGLLAGLLISLVTLGVYTLLLFDVSGETWGLHNLRFGFHYAVLVAYFYVVRAMVRRYGTTNVAWHLIAGFGVMLVAVAHQWATGYLYPNTVVSNSGFPIWFGSTNVASLALLGALAVVLQQDGPSVRALGAFAAGTGLIWINSSRAALLAACLLLVATITVAILPRFRLRHPALRLVAGLGMPVAVVLLAYQASHDVPIQMPGHTTTLRELVTEPATHILNLEPSGRYTSVDVRADLTIYGIQALADSAWLGVGPGNTISITHAHYSPDLIGSFHNIVAQLATEYGLLFLVGMVGLARFLVRPRASARTLAALSALLVGTLSSAASLLTNYYFLACFFVLLLPTHPGTGVVNEPRRQGPGAGTGPAEEPVFDADAVR